MEKKFKELAYTLEVAPSDELWKRFQRQRNQPKRKTIWVAIAASLFFVLTINFFYTKNNYQLQPLESSTEIQSNTIVSITNYPSIEEGKGKIKIASPFN